MPLTLTLARAFMKNRVRAQRKMRPITYGTVIMTVFLMFYFTQTRAGQVSPTADIIEFSAWRILASLTFTIMAMGLSELGNENEQEFLASIGLRGSTYMWAKWVDLGLRSLPWFLWGASWAMTTAAALSGHPFVNLVGLAIMLFLYALALGGFLGFGLETLLRRVKYGRNASKSIAMFAPFAMIFAMMGMGQSVPVPKTLHSLAGLTPIGPYLAALRTEPGRLMPALVATATIIPWIAGIWLVGLAWNFRRYVPGRTPDGGDKRSREPSTQFQTYPFILKDLVMLRRYKFTFFRGVAAAAFLAVPFTFLNSQTNIPLFLKFFEVMIVVVASGLMFGLLLPAMDREVLWMIRITGRLRSYLMQKFALVTVITISFSALIIAPLTFTLHLPVVVVVALAVVGAGLVAALCLIGSGLATKFGIDMVARPDANIVTGIMLVFGLYLVATVLGYIVSPILFIGFLAFWSLVIAAALGVATYIFTTLELV